MLPAEAIAACTLIAALLMAPAWNSPPRTCRTSSMSFALVIGNGSIGSAAQERPTTPRRLRITFHAHGIRRDVEVDATRAEMIEIIRAFGSKLAKQKGGLFYFAGHGRNWRGATI
jgi:hypothetical protein